MKRFVLIVGLILSGCTFYSQNYLELTVMKNKKTVPKYNVGIRLPMTYGRHPMSPYFNSKEMVPLGNFQTDEQGKLRIPLNVAIGIPPKRAKPIFLISSSDISSCELLLWYLEEYNYFVPLKFKDGETAGAIKYTEDVTGNFIFNGNGWNISATINRADRICEE